MKKISKTILTLLVVGLVFSLSACFKNDVIAHNGEIKLYLDEEYYSYMPYAEVPSFIISFDGVINTISNSPNTNATVFAQNDDIKFSKIVEKLINDYGVYTEIVKTKQSATTKINTISEDGETISLKLNVDDDLVYDEVSYLALDNGLKATINYRRFASDGVTYYAWRYSSSIAIYLYYPLMVAKIDGKKKILILSLPNRIEFQVGSQLKLDSIIKKDEYLNEAKYFFTYLEDEAIPDQKQYVSDYYLHEHNAYYEDDELYFSYLDIVYQVKFYEKGFSLIFIKTLE